MPSESAAGRPWAIGAGYPAAGRHYPRTEIQFAQWFPDDAAARDYLEAVRFREGDGCVRCGTPTVLRRPSGVYWCGGCRRSFTITTATLMERTHVDALVWLRAVWHMTNRKDGVAALSIERALGLNHATAWYLAHKIRAAMAQRRYEWLTGDVEMDEAYLGGQEPTGQGAQRPTSNKACTLVAVERIKVTNPKLKGREYISGRARMQRVYEPSVHCLEKFIEENIEPGSLIVTDAYAGYPPAIRRLKARGLRYGHQAYSMRALKTKAHELMPCVNPTISHLKRVLTGTHSGAVKEHQLDAYLDEFVFRFNRRRSRSRGLLFWRVVCSLLSVTALGGGAIVERKESLKVADAATAKMGKQVSDEVRRARNRLEQQKGRARRASSEA